MVRRGLARKDVSMSSQAPRAKLAFSTLGCPGWSLDRVVRAAHEYGYDGVELRLLDGEIINADLPAGERRRLRDTFAAASLPICCLDTSIRVAADGDLEATIGELRAFVALANEIGAPFVRVFGGESPAEWSPEAAFDRAAAVLNGVAADAEAAGVAVVLETHDAFASAKSVAEVLRRAPRPAHAGAPAVGALWDTHHPYRMGEQPDEVIDLLGDRILHVHVKDARRNDAARTGWDLLLLGEGEVPVRDSLTTLRARGYDGWIAIEWEKKWHPHIPEPEVAFPQHIALLRQWLGA
jgi:fatty-acyl-CoA synthase